MTQELLNCLDAGLKMAETSESIEAHMKIYVLVVSSSIPYSPLYWNFILSLPSLHNARIYIIVA